MKTNDIRLLGEIETLESNRGTEDYKIVVLHGIGNKSLELVYMAKITTLNNSFVYSDNVYYTSLSEAIESLWLKMFEFQDRLDEKVNRIMPMIEYVLGEN